MGSGQSSRATHFQRPTHRPLGIEDPDEKHISISNKMVERLVEDATLAAGGEAKASIGATPRGDFKDKIFMEKLRCLDENHSEKLGLTVEDLSTMTKRIELRTANMVSFDPVCPECKQDVIDCYENSTRTSRVLPCYETVGAFAKCVQRAAATRLQARTEKEARELARRSRHVAHAREHALRDLAPPPAPTQA